MRAKHFLTAACIAAIALGATAMTSCNRDNDEPARDEVKIITSINGTSNASLTKAAIDPATGAGNLENGDKIKLYYHGEPINAGGRKTITYTIGSTLYWDEVVSGVGGTPTAYAFYAYWPDAFDPEDATWNAAKAAEPDLLFAKAEGVAVKGTVNLTFGHLMHKMVVNLSSNVYDAAALAAAKVTPQNLKSTAAVNTFAGTVELNAATGTDAYPARTGVSTSHIVAPQSGLTAGGDLLKIEVAGNTHYYKVPSGLTALESGKVLTLNLSITRDAVTLDGMGVTGWGNQGTENGDIDFND